MKKTTGPLIILSALLGTILVYFSSGLSRQAPENTSTKSSDDNLKKQTLLAKPAVIDPAIKNHLASKDPDEDLVSKKPIDDKKLAVESNTENELPFSGISRPSDKAKEILEKAGVLPKDISQEAYVEFDLDSLRALEVGDTFNLEIPQSLEMYAAEVTKVEKFNNGDKSVFGRLVGSDGVLHTTVLTVGEDAVYGQFTTVTANYVFESKGKYGWIAAKRDLYKNHVEFEAVQVGATTQGPDDVFAPQD